MEIGIVIIICVVFSIALPSAAAFGIWIIISHWNATFVKVREPGAQLLSIFAVLLTALGFLTLVVLLLVCKVHNQWTWYTAIFSDSMLLSFYSISSYRTWMLLYKSKLQLSLTGFEIDEILRASNENMLQLAGTARATFGPGKTLKSFWIDHRGSLGNSSKMSIFFFAIFLLTVIMNSIFAYKCGFECIFEPYFHAYDYFNTGICCVFVIFNVTSSVNTMMHFRDSFCFTGEVLMVSCLFAAGFSIFWLVFLASKEKLDDRLVFAIFIIIAMLLLILITINYNLYWAHAQSKLPRRIDLTINDILSNASICNQFEDHLRKEFSLENLNFLKTCERFQEFLRFSDNCSLSEGAEEDFRSEFKISLCCSNDFRNRKSVMARYIYEQFCARGSPQEINLSREIRNQLRQQFEGSNLVCSEEVFDRAINCIKDLLTNDSLRRFKASTEELYLRL